MFLGRFGNQKDRGNFKRVIQLKSTGELKVAAYNKQFTTDNTEKSSETCLGREEKIRQELQSQHFSGQRKEAKQIKFAIIVAKTAIFYVFVGSANTIWVAPNNTPRGNI